MGAVDVASGQLRLFPQSTYLEEAKGDVGVQGKLARVPDYTPDYLLERQRNRNPWTSIVHSSCQKVKNR